MSEKSLSTSELIHSAQIELARLGCFSGELDGTLNAATQVGINRYLSGGDAETSNRNHR